MNIEVYHRKGYSVPEFDLIIFDADGTLRRCTIEGQPCPNKPGEWELMPGLTRHPHFLTPPRIAIASNQGGVGLGLLSKKIARQMLIDLFKELTGSEPEAWQIQICPHVPNAGCECRKPMPGMIHAAMKGARITEPTRVLFVGDMESDRQAAAAAGVAFKWAQEFFQQK